MPKSVEITCDNCTKNLTAVSSGFDEYRFSLRREGIHNLSNVKFAMVHSPPYPAEAYFCDLKCLKEWLDKQ